ncbi:MAG TPA: hypothetical protein VNQ79_29235 [Blastocatellia bacterium]|nr:hypothetical protein [Blastocatellia bacterium]
MTNTEYETLDDTGFHFEQTGLRAARLRADFGDGYTAGARVGSAEGLRAWRLRIDALPDLPEYLIGQQTRARYLWEFWRRHKLEKESEVFRLRDPFPADPSRPFVFARFTEDELNFGMFCELVFSVGLTLIQCRVRGLDANDFNPQSL